MDFQFRTRIFILKILSFLCSHILVREFFKKNLAEVAEINKIFQIYIQRNFPQNYVFGEFYGKNETIQNVEPTP